MATSNPGSAPNRPQSDAEPALPHDRDERAGPPREDDQRRNRAPIAQAHRDVESGLKNTERIGTPSNVPGAADDASG